MRIRSGTEQVDPLFTNAAPGKPEVKNQPTELRRVVKRLRTLFAPHFESAGRMGITLGPDDLRAVIDGLLAEADGLNPASHFACPDELRQYLRLAIFDELVGEPSNILYTTQVNSETVRYDAMPVDFWKQCLNALKSQLDPAQSTKGVASAE